MSTKMKAAFYNKFNDSHQIEVGELEKPIPKEGEVLVRIQSAGVNPVDAAVARGMLKDAIPTSFPVIPGWDMAGVVEECGFSAQRFKKGDEVYAYARRPTIQQGTFAEYISLPESYLALRPESLSMEESGGVPLTGLTAYQSLFDTGQLTADETVLILGASGGVGSLAIQLAKWKGATVIGVAGSSNQKFMKELGADETIDYNTDSLKDAVLQIAPEGVDMIFQCSRGNSLEQTSETIKKNGRLISITDSNPNRRDDVQFQYVFVEPNAVQLEHLKEIADSGNLQVSVSKTFTLNETPQALREIESLHTRGKIVILPS